MDSGSDWPHCHHIHISIVPSSSWRHERVRGGVDRLKGSGVWPNPTTDDAYVWPLSWCRILLLAMSHTITVESHDADASPPIESNATLVTGARCPSSTATQAPEPAFHSRTVKSAAQLANRVPSKLSTRERGCVTAGSASE